VRLQLHGEPTATREYLQSRLGADDLVVWDARGPQEFSGESPGRQGRHIPGAINFEWTAGMDKNDHLRIRKDIAQCSNNWASPQTRK
jgi:thiosulfate/3-mercaptopyruvate sulfurtransferase